MASRAASPGAALLRTSRMFSMPPAIASSSSEISSGQLFSKTATVPHPTHLSITTPSEARKRGDWGFKRPLPLKTTLDTTTPVVRVREVDSVEHVTDFQSASDHTLTLEKWKEMRIPITLPIDSARTSTSVTQRIEKSVFEDDNDFTHFEPGREVDLENKRWKFHGPWIAGMTQGQFQEYVANKVRNRRGEFRQFLRQRLAAETTQEDARQAKSKGGVAPPPVKPESITSQQLLEYYKKLREDRPLLFKLVGRFLDLAPITTLESSLQLLGSLQPHVPLELSRDSPWAKDGPPKTHPSAGMSYLRTNNFVDNHPIYGPQKDHPPVKARIVMPRTAVTGNYEPKLGVGGFITETPQGETTFRDVKGNASNVIPGLNGFEPDVPGGSKVYIKTTGANIDPTGKFIIKVTDASKEAELVQKELVGETTIFSQTEEPAAEQPMFSPRPRRNSRIVAGSRESYGL